LLAAIGAIAVGMFAPPAATAAPDSKGQEFWLAFPGNFSGGSEKTLFITGDESATGTVEIPGLAFTSPFTVTPGSVTSVPLPSNSDLATADGVEAKGIHVTADREVTVYGLNRQSATTDAYLGLPVDVLGTEYIVLGYGPGQGGTSQLAVAASQDGTTVTITPKVNGSGGHTAGTPYTVNLASGDAYQLRAASTNQDLSGSIITADKPVGVYGGHQCANIPSSSFFACDHVVEQMPPTSTWGGSFGTVPLKTRQNGDTFQILAGQDGTEVKVNGAAVANLDRTGVHNQIIDGRATITANNPILVAQYSNSSSFDGVTSDPFEMLIPPLEQFLPGYTVTTPASGFPSNFINLVVPDSAVGSAAVDGAAVPPGEYAPIGSSGFSGAQVDVSIGSHNLTGGGQPFGAFMYGFASFDSYGYPGGQSFAPIASVVSIELNPPTATHPVGTQQCVTATLRDQNGAGVPDVRVDFVVSGVNSASGFQNANASGNAQFCYTGNNLGNDTITASVGQLKATAAKTWVSVSPDSKESCFSITIDGSKVQGTEANEKLTGTSKSDLLRGGGGKDEINGDAAADCLFGQSGGDNVSGDDGGDIIRGGSGNDKLTAGDGDDDVRAQDGDDRVNGGPGNDKIKAQGRGRDRVNCGSGNDTVIGDVKDKISVNCEKVKIVDPN